MTVNRESSPRTHHLLLVAIALSPDGKTVATGSWNDQTVRVWEVVRALEVLERADTRAARQLLLELSRGAPEAWLTQQAKAIVQRTDFPRAKR